MHFNHFCRHVRRLLHAPPVAPVPVLLIIALCTPFLPQSAGATFPPPLHVSPKSHASLEGHLELLVDAAGKLSLNEVLAETGSRGFKPIPAALNRGYTSETSWVRFSVLGDGGPLHDYYLSLGPSMLDHVTIYVQEGEDPLSPRSYRKFVFGDHHPIAERPVRHPSFVAPLLLTDGKPKMIYVRVRTTSTHHLRGWVYPKEDFIFSSVMQSLFTGGYAGICLIIAVMNLVFALRLRDMLYCHYSLYVLTHFAGAMGMEGILPLFWPSGAHLFADYFASGGITLGFTTFALFAMRLFETRGERPLAHAYLLATFFLGVFGFLAIPFGFHRHVSALLAANGLVFVPFLTWLAIDLIRKGAPAGKLFLTAFLVSNVAGILGFMRLLGGAPVNWVTLYSLPVGTILSMVLMTLALTERLHAAEKKALAASRQAQQDAVVLAEEMTRELVEKQRDLENAFAKEQESQKTQVRFFETVSHEYRTPLAIIRTNLDILEMKACTPCPFSPNLGIMKRGVARMVEVVEVARGSNRLQDMDLKMRREPILLVPFLEELMAETRGLWVERQLELDTGNAEGAVITGDAGHLKTALLNLVDNAVKYSAESEPVKVRVSVSDGDVLVTIRDRGCGIPPGELERVFEKFFRGKGSTDTRGAGVGLSIVRKIIIQHGGKVWLESPDTGGAVAKVSLPLSKENELFITS